MTKFFFEYVCLYFTMHKSYKKILKNNHPEKYFHSISLSQKTQPIIAKRFFTRNKKT